MTWALIFVNSCDVELGTMEDGVDQKMGTPDEILKAFQDWDPRLVLSFPE